MEKTTALLNATQTLLYVEQNFPFKMHHLTNWGTNYELSIVFDYRKYSTKQFMNELKSIVHPDAIFEHKFREDLNTEYINIRWNIY